MAINPDRAMFEALNILSKSIDKYDSKKLEKPIDVKYETKGMWYNGQYIDYPEGHSYDPTTGFTIHGKPKAVLYFATKDYIFITNSKQFEYYIDMADGCKRALSSIKAAWIAFARLMMHDCRDITLVSTSDCTDILMVDGSKYSSYGEFKLDLNTAVITLTESYIVTLAMSLVLDLINTTRELKEPLSFQFIVDYLNKIEMSSKTMEAVFMTTISGIDVPERVVEMVIDTIQELIFSVK